MYALPQIEGPTSQGHHRNKLTDMHTAWSKTTWSSLSDPCPQSLLSCEPMCLNQPLSRVCGPRFDKVMATIQADIPGHLFVGQVWQHSDHQMSRGEKTTSSGILRSRQPRSSVTDTTPRLDITLRNTTNIVSSRILPKGSFDMYHSSHGRVSGGMRMVSTWGIAENC